MIDPRRAGRYERIHEQLRDLIEGTTPTLVAGMATICAVLHAKLPHHFWTGFYFRVDSNTMHVGPYQGPPACQVLTDSGVCLHAARSGEATVVPDVEAFPGHIACDSRSKSEIVIPLMKGDEVVAVLDVDAKELAQFDDDDVEPLTRIVNLLQPLL